MRETGRKSQITLQAQGWTDLAAIHWNHEAPNLYELALSRGEGLLSEKGALVVKTGEHTGRSARDKFIVCDKKSESAVWWDANKKMTPDHFARLHDDIRHWAKGKEIFVQDLYAGADKTHRMATRVLSEYAWHSLFIRNLLIEPDEESFASWTPELTIIDFPSFRADPERHGARSSTIIALDLSRNLVIIAGTSYAGEIKKSVFSVLNYHLPEKDVMPMHCSVNVGRDGDAAIFFGLSGTGKTTLSADSERALVGDDEHGWSSDGLFNFEGGCYAKLIRLSAEAEPEIHATTQRFGTVLENVVMDGARRLDLDDGSLTENTRGAYPISFIPNIVGGGCAGQPKTIIMLTADAFGVLPPIARLSAAHAMYHFLSGYTAKVAGTEKGVLEPEATFSACFGAPFMARPPQIYGNLLRSFIARHGVDCWLVNTGWTGGPYGVGERMPIRDTRALLKSALSGALRHAPMRRDPFFGLDVPEKAPGVHAVLLDPRAAWRDKGAYDKQALKLLRMFEKNFEKFASQVDKDVLRAAPSLAAAE